jgi:hypothetical protein
MDSFFDRLKHSWDAMNLAATAASVGMVLVATGLQAAVIQAFRGAAPNPIPDVQGLIDETPRYWELFRQPAPLTIAITLIAAMVWPAEQKTRPPRNEKELVQSMLRKGPSIVDMVFLGLTALIALVLAVWIGRLEVLDQPDVIAPIRSLGLLHIIIVVINVFGKFYLAYGADSFWSSMVLGICLGALVRSLVNTWGPRSIA